MHSAFVFPPELLYGHLYWNHNGPPDPPAGLNPLRQNRQDPIDSVPIRNEPSEGQGNTDIMN